MISVKTENNEIDINCGLKHIILDGDLVLGELQEVQSITFDYLNH